MKSFDEYSIRAKIYPAILTSLPFYIFYFSWLNDHVGRLLNQIVNSTNWSSALSLSSGASLQAAITFFFIEINRYISKFIFEKIVFASEFNFATTNLLLYTNNEFSENYKNIIRKKVYDVFKIKLPTRRYESTNIKEARKLINEAVGLIRERVKKGSLLHEYNIRYGFARNFIGGCVIALLVSLFNIIFFSIVKIIIPIYISVVLSFIYLSALLMSKIILNKLGHEYAKKLYSEFLDQ
ncbi:hypothetical protein HGA88_01810 [Candidatus Roizmanbacteria bacterium]|nr:hypothetical protein [Candidatus Roizmanbacteria bacterium]